MNIILIILLLAAVFGLPLIIYNVRKRRIAAGPMPDGYLRLLNEKVDFYQQLDHEKKTEFENRLQLFLSKVKITGVGTEVEDIDRVLIASGAIIPIFGFRDWEYINLNEVLLYPDNFGDDFDPQSNERNILGLVGSGAFQNMMILSKQHLRNGFEDKDGKGNTAIHEFVHLIDKTDGAVDGIPEFLLSRQLTLPWLNKIHESIQLIMQNRSDINPYGATNQAEFFAVVSEYFFKRPDLLKSNHRELYEMLETIFRQQPKSGIIGEEI